MKKWILALMLMLILAVPSFAQDTDVPPSVQGKLGATGVALTPPPYKKIFAFQGFTSDAPQFYYSYPLSAVSPGDTLYGHIQWELNYVKPVETTRTYKMTVTGPAGVFTDSVTYTTYPGEYGERWQALRIPTELLTSGYYQMKMKVSVKGGGSKTVKTWFRVY